ncbi:hypothetical protein D3C80_1721970 [compost metagenome]
MNLFLQFLNQGFGFLDLFLQRRHGFALLGGELSLFSLVDLGVIFAAGSRFSLGISKNDLSVFIEIAFKRLHAAFADQPESFHRGFDKMAVVGNQDNRAVESVERMH